MNKFNLNWTYYPYNIKEKGITSDKEVVNLPHTNKEVPLSYFDEKCYQFVSSYQKKFNLNKKEDKLYIIDFLGVLTVSELYVNDKYVATNYWGYIDFVNDITKYLVNGENVITVIVDSSEVKGVPPFGGVIDYLTFGGIYREVTFVEKSLTYIVNAKASYYNDKTTIKVELNKEYNGKIDVSIENLYNNSFTCNSNNILLDLGDIKPELWDIDNPRLYKIVISIEDDSYSFDFGFRTVCFKEDGFYLNNKLLKLRGLDHHQSYPFIGYAATANAQVIDVIKLKEELGVNIVRCSHYPHDINFLNACDKYGLLVFEEIPGWQHLGDDSWQDIACQYVTKMINYHYNHCSIIIWGVRINESLDCHDFYIKTNKIAHDLDNTRQTTGVRYFPTSERLEDVFSFNEFINNHHDEPNFDYLIENQGHVPFLLTEFCGHTYPTKKIDNEERLQEQALRHAAMHAGAYKSKFVSGAIAWCMFDYNTHKQFGSGDRICYHGVLDMFRMPKIASYFYKSQLDPKKQIVLEPASIFAFGERCFGGVIPLYIYHNCEQVSLQVIGKEEEFITKVEDKFKSLEHPPVVLEKLDGNWGDDCQDVIIRGYIAGKMVAMKRYLTSQIPSNIDVKLYDSYIALNDMTRIELRYVDSQNNTLKFSNEIVNITVSNGKLIGPNVIPLYGGEYAFYIRSTEVAIIKVEINIGKFSKKLEIEVKTEE